MRACFLAETSRAPPAIVGLLLGLDQLGGGATRYACRCCLIEATTQRPYI